MKIGLIVAMDSEYRRLEHLLGDKACGMLGGNEVVLCRCGIGKVNSALGAATLIRESHPDCVISTGVAGGADEHVAVMDIVVGTTVCYHDVWCGEGNVWGQVQGLPALYDADPLLVSSATQLLPSADRPTTVHGGLICSGDQFVTDRAHIEEIKHRFPTCLAVDMESASIAQTCYLYRVPFLALRIVSDACGATAERQQQYSDFWSTLSDRAFATLSTLLQQLPTGSPWPGVH